MKLSNPNSIQHFSSLQCNRCLQCQTDRASTQWNPNGQGISTDLLGSETTVGNGTWNSNWDRNGASVSGSSDNNAGDGLSIRGQGVGHSRGALVAGHSGSEGGADVVVLEGDDGPVDEAGHLIKDRLDPHLEERVLAGSAVDNSAGDIGVSQVGLVEHEGVVVQTEKVARVGGTLDVKESGNGA